MPTSLLVKIRFKLLLFSIMVFCFAKPTRATTVVPPSFSELVAESGLVARVKVKAIQCVWKESAEGRFISTIVTFALLRAIKGNAEPEFQLSFLGGEIDGQNMAVSGMPRFIEGQTNIIFVSEDNARFFCPLVRMMHGRYHIVDGSSGARSYVARDDRVPLTSEHDVELPQERHSPSNRLKSINNALSPEVFEETILQEYKKNELEK